MTQGTRGIPSPADGLRDVPDARPEAGRRRGWWPATSALVGLLVWYPAGWVVPAALPPMQLVHGEVIALGSVAAALGASLVVATWWARVLVLVAASATLWFLDPVPADHVAHEPTLVLILLAAGQGVGFLLGSLLRRGPVRVGVGLALLAAVTTSDRYAGWLLGAALVVVALAVRRRDGASLVRAVGGWVLVAAAWLAAFVTAFSFSYGWGTVRRGSGFPTTPEAAVARVLEPMLEFLRSSSGSLVEASVTVNRLPLLVGAALALAVAGLRLAVGPGPGGRRP